MPLLSSLLILIVAARVLGRLFQRFKQPAIVGEMLAGILLGPSVLNFISPSPALSGISELAVFLVVLSAGLEMNLQDVIKALIGRGSILAILSFLLPLTSGIFLGLYFDFDVMRSVFLGLCISITALPVTVRILHSFHLLESTIAKYSVAAAIFTDVAALLVFGVILNLPENMTFEAVGSSVLTISAKLILLGSFIVAVNWTLHRSAEKGLHFERIPERLVELLGSEALFGVLVLFVLIFGSASELLGFHFVIGAFFGALLIDRKYFLASRFSEIKLTLDSITGGFLAPVFFAYLGLSFKIQEVHSIHFVLLVLIVSIVSKIISGWLGGLFTGLSQSESFGIGILLNGRGIMELVVAGIAYQKGLIEQGLFSALVIMGVVTTMMTPMLFKKIVLRESVSQ